MAKKVQIPFDQQGQLIHQDCTRYGIPPYEWRDNYTFQDTLRFDGFSNMKTSVQVKFTSLKDGKRHLMFLSEFARIILENAIHDGNVSGLFTFAKKGTCYSVSWVGKEENAE